MNEGGESMETWAIFKSVELDKSIDRPDYINVYDNEKGVKFELINDNGQKILIFFEGGVLSYRVSDEGRRIKTINFLGENYSNLLLSNNILMISDDSDYLCWFNQETYDMFSKHNIHHYLIMTRNEIADVLSVHSPDIKVIG